MVNRVEGFTVVMEIGTWKFEAFVADDRGMPTQFSTTKSCASLGRADVSDRLDLFTYVFDGFLFTNRCDVSLFPTQG